MNEPTVTESEARARFTQAGYMDSAIDYAIKYLFPPFEPKEGEVIAVRNSSSDTWTFRKFQSMDGDRYVCNSGTSTYHWSYARPLTDKEKGL